MLPWATPGAMPFEHCALHPGVGRRAQGVGRRAWLQLRQADSGRMYSFRIQAKAAVCAAFE